MRLRRGNTSSTRFDSTPHLSPLHPCFTSVSIPLHLLFLLHQARLFLLLCKVSTVTWREWPGRTVPLPGLVEECHVFFAVFTHVCMLLRYVWFLPTEVSGNGWKNRNIIRFSSLLKLSVELLRRPEAELLLAVQTTTGARVSYRELHPGISLFKSTNSWTHVQSHTHTHTHTHSIWQL